MTDAFKMIAIATAMTIGGGLASPAFAADNAMQVCGAKYQAAKKANTLPAGQTWNQYLAQCRAGLAKPAAVTPPAKPAPAAAAKPAKAVTPAKPAIRPGQPTAAQAAMYAREKQCGAQWRADKAAKKVPASETWPQYWSACNKRMK
ncbi:MAG: hypothetical protein JSR79_02460 [Proteobacteria bacterium]|nr:hypothetical protein [Pseudomonadota bacterium]